MLSIHAAALAAPNVPYHDFLLAYSASGRFVYGFVEGKEDPMFYRDLISKELPAPWKVKLFPVGNRQAVIDLRDSFDWSSFSADRICFFLDRDLKALTDPFEKHTANTYVTDGYSIENSIVDEDMLLNVLADVCQIAGLHPFEEDAIIDVYRYSECTFLIEIASIMAQILIWRRTGEKANLNNVQMGAFFSFDQGCVSALPAATTLVALATQVGCNLSDPKTLKMARAEILAQPDLRMIVRGKYLFWFFVHQIDAIWQVIPRISSRFAKPPKKKIVYGPRNAIQVLGPRSRIPQTLRQFVGGTYLQFIASAGSAP